MTSKRLQFYKRTPNCIFPFMPGIKDMKECVKHMWRPNWAENVSWPLWWCCWRGTETLRHTHSIIFRRQSCCYANKPLLTDCYSVTDRMQILSSCPLSVFVLYIILVHSYTSPFAGTQCPHSFISIFCCCCNLHRFLCFLIYCMYGKGTCSV